MENLIFDFISRHMPLSEAEKQAITDLSIFRAYKMGTVLLRAGECPREGYFVLTGCLRSYYLIDGEEKTTNFHTEFESFSPLGLVTGKPSDHYLDCLEECTLAVGNPDMEKTMFERFPRFETLCRILSEELAAKNQSTFDQFKTSSPEQRYLDLIRHRPDLVRRVPQYQLASYLGMTPQSLSRIRRRLSCRA
jgi:CRP-like cAMP-binding protein